METFTSPANPLGPNSMFNPAWGLFIDRSASASGTSQLSDTQEMGLFLVGLAVVLMFIAICHKWNEQP